MTEKQFNVLGMTCASCQAAVSKAVGKVEGVESVDVALLSNSMKVSYDPQKTSETAIIQAVENIGYEANVKGQMLQEGQQDSVQAQWDQRKKQMEEEQNERKKALVWSIVLLVPLMVIAMAPHMGLLTFFMELEWAMVSTILQLILTMFILFFQRQFFIHGLKALWKRVPNMDSLVAIGGGAAFVYGVWGILRMAYGYGIMDHAIIHESMHALYFESAATIVTLVSLGKYLEARSKSKTSDALSKLVDLAPKTAVIEKDGTEIQVATDQIVSGDLVVIRPGQRIPVDGIVASGTGYVDQAAITGESIPVEKEPGDPVISATMNINGSFKFTATKVGSDTTLAQIIRLVDEAGNTKAPIARLADQVSGIFVPVVIAIALCAGLFWLLTGHGFEFSLSIMISVLVISCPCALGLATPVAIMVATGKAAEYGILIKQASSLETLHSVDSIVLDKTGTITSGKPGVVSITLFDPEISRDAFLSLAASLELGSEHPLGKAIVEQAGKEHLALQQPEKFTAISGRGLEAELQQQKYLAGNVKLMEENGIAFSALQKEQLDQLARKGQTPLLFARGRQLIGMIGTADTIRPTSRQAIEKFKEKNIYVVMLTGDNQQTANAIAADLHVNEVIADVLPAQKENVIRALQDKGRKVAMVGDGINDAPALARADIGIAIGAGTDIAIDSADIVLMKDNLLDVNTAIDLSHATIRNIRQNLFWAFFYNACGIPLAAGLFYPFFGWTLSPMFGSAAMSLSSVCVVANALRLRLFSPADENVQQIKGQEVTAQEIAVFESWEKAVERAWTHPDESVLTFTVNGMSCQHCAGRVEQALKKLEGVQKVDVDLEKKSVHIISSRPVLEAEAFEAVKKAGYEPEPGRKEETMKKVIKVEGMSCQHCQKRVEQALANVAGVVLANVNLADGTAAVESANPIGDEILIKAIEDAGYKAAEIKESE